MAACASFWACCASAAPVSYTPLDVYKRQYEYYELTKEAGDAAADMTYEDMLAAGVGVEAPDDYTLVFTCKNPCPYFDTVAADVYKRQV